MRFPRSFLLFLLASWVLVVLYPDPGVLVRSAANIVRPRVDPAAVSALAARLPADPRAIEAYVLDRAVPYAYDWQSAGVPWYFPTTAEAVSAGRGDCESRALVLASILTAKGIPNQLRVSFDHIWVDYPGKQANALENAGVVLAGTEGGHFFIHWPKDFHLGQEISDNIAIFWTPAPPVRVVLLFAGLLLIAAGNAVSRVCAGGRPAVDPAAPAPGEPALLAPPAAGGRRRGRLLRRRLAARGTGRPAAGLAARPQRV